MTLAFTLFALAHQNATLPILPPPDKVVITVNGHNITAKELEAYMYDWDAARIGSTLAVYEVIHQEAAKKNIHIQDAAVKSGVEMEVNQMIARAPKGSDPKDFLKKNGVSMSQIEFRVRAQMMLRELANVNFNPNNYYRVATIVIQPKTQAAADVQASLTSAGTAYSALLKGDGWDQVFATYTTNAKSVPNNGELGWIDIDQFPATTKEEMLLLKVGSYTKPVQTPNGIQIFKLEGRSKDATPDELKQLKDRYVATAERDIVTKLQSSAKITYSY